MSFIKIGSFFRNLFRKDEVDEQLDQEVSSYVAMLADEKMDRGMSREQAVRAAKVELGGSDQVKEQVREVRTGAWLESLLQDLRFGWRMVMHNPGFSALVVLTLALGIGANTAIFSVVYGVLLRPLPYADGSKLVVLKQQASKARLDSVPFSPKEVFDYRDYNHTLQSVVEYHSMSFLLLGKENAERVQTGVVSANFFDVLGTKPLLGRTFVPADETKGADAVLVLSYEYWQRHQGGDPSVVGKVFQMNNRPHTVIGVLPPIPQYPSENDVYMPTTQCPFRSSPRTIENRQARMLPAVFGRLKPGVTLQSAQADLSTIARQLESSYPKDYPKEYGYGLALAPLQNELIQRARLTLIVLLGAAGFVLLIACANVANLMLARVLKRERELAVRSALGASKLRLIRQLLTEAVMLALAGGALGLLIAPPALRLLVKFAARFTTRAGEVKIDWPILLFTLLASILAGILAGFVPAISSSRQITDALKQATGQTTASGSRQRMRAALVVAQVTVSFMLLVGAGLMLRSIVNLQRVDPGFRVDHLLTLRMSANFSKYTTNQDFEQLSDNVLRKVSSIGGVESAAIVSNYPFSKQGIVSGPGNTGIQIEGRLPAPGETPPQIDLTLVSPDYFNAIRQPLLEGRFFTDHDDHKAVNVGIINQTMRHHFWSTEDPIGKRITTDQGQSWITIAGVVGDAREYGLQHDVLDEIYLPVKQFGGANRLVVRTATDPMSMASLVRSALHDVDPQLAVDQVDSMDRLEQDSMASPRTTTILLGIFAGLALLISATGIAGVMALSINQRAHELGIRLALGQSKSSILQMVVRQGLAMAVMGTILGIIGALALARLLSSLLYQTSPTDALTYSAVALVFLLAAAISCFVPAHRVTLIDPSQALRQE
ncbi:MAG TPA: ABC transporter permease [Terriglobales bacterium]|jgi:putative ABC transport system permease protein|nr:ABC transporter permease [Terriglobales bacterium]